MGFKEKKFCLVNQGVLFALGFLVLQQLIVASSTIWITRLIAHIQEGSFSYQFLALYLTSLFLPYFPGAAALVEVAKAKVRANIRFVDSFASVYRGQVYEWTNFSHHSTKSSILTGETSQTINGYYDYMYHFASCGLNVVLNLLVLAFIIEPWLLASYAIGMILAFSILKIQKRWKKILSLRAQQGRIKWISMLLKAWDNILLDNIYNFTLWEKKTRQRGKRLERSAIRLESLSQGVSVGMAFVLLGPSFVLIWYLPQIDGFDLTRLAIMVVALPRLFQVLSYSYEMLFVLADFPMQKSRFKTVVKLLDTSDLPHSDKAIENLEKRIQWDKICVKSEGVNLSAKTFIDALSNKGRYTISGENGSGKSSLLLLLKVLKGQDAFYLPAKHELTFQLSKNGFSTGQLARKTLNEIMDRLKTQIVLLDEWDANLDGANQKDLSLAIDQMAQVKCIIEVRHRMP